MNLLDSDSNSLHKRYVANKMQENKLETISASFQPKRKRFVVNKNVILYMIFGCLVLFGTIAFSTDKFIVNADKINSNNEGQNIQFVSAPSTPLVPKIKKNASSSYVRGDNRVIALKKYLELKDSPVSNFAYIFVRSADEAGIDYRLVASISGVESGFCKATTIRLDSNLPTHNCWGWGKTGRKFSEFNTWEEAITTITKGIARGYGKNANPDNMSYMYCQSCRGNSKWQDSVKGYMSDISYIEKKLSK